VGVHAWAGWGLCLVGVGLLNAQVLSARRAAKRAGSAFGFSWNGVSGAAPKAAKESRTPGMTSEEASHKTTRNISQKPSRDASEKTSGGVSGGAWLIAVPGLAMLLVAACCPPGTVWRVEALGYDVTSYHLQIPREWVSAGAMVELQHNVYGYLPGLMEAAYASLMAMAPGSLGENFLSRGSGERGVVGAVYTCQLFHASFAVLAAWAVAATLRGWVSQTAAAAGGALVLLVPWTIVTGSLAYNEQVAVAFGAVGLSLVMGKAPPCGRMAAAVGLLAGAATLAKLTAAFTVALPLGGLLVWRLCLDRPMRKTLAPIALCVLVGSAALLPYLARNAAWTGNPVFPFARETLGGGHWDSAHASRWNAAHMPELPWSESLGSVWRQALGNTGYGAVGGGVTAPESRNIARFGREGGVPVLWIAAAFGLAAGLIRRRSRVLAGAALVWMLWQFAWWLGMTHLQSRFLILCVLPLCLGAGLLIDAVAKLPGRAGVTGPPLCAAVLGVTLAAMSLTVTWSQTARLTLPDGRRAGAALWMLVDGLPSPHGTGVLTDLPTNSLPVESKVMVVGNNQALFYIRPTMVYASAFDPSPMTAILRHTTDPREVASRLRASGITHLWIGYSELDRLHATYGFDAEVTTESLSRLVADWQHLTPPGPTVLVAVPKP